MELLVIGAQLVVALGIYNVWLLRNGRPTEWRGGNAASLRDEFAVYGLPAWVMALVGTLKLTFASLLLIGLWVPAFVVPAAVGLAVLMLGAVLMHAKIADPPRRWLPAAAMLALCLFVVAMQSSPLIGLSATR